MEPSTQAYAICSDDSARPLFKKDMYYYIRCLEQSLSYDEAWSKKTEVQGNI